MQVVYGLNSAIIEDYCKSGSVVSIGNFDGVHLGHQKLLTKAVDIALKENLPALAIFFEPQPEEFIAKTNDLEIPVRLFSSQEKLFHLANLGIDLAIVINFDSDFAQIKAEDFIENILVNHLKARHLVLGADFRFGKARQGDIELLKNQGLKYRFAVNMCNTLEFQGQRISSSLIKELLKNGDLLKANRLLGKPYSIFGIVVEGNKLGTKLGFSTANIELKNNVPLNGVFAVKVKIVGLMQEFQAVANLGNRPTVDGKKKILEVHILEFNEQIYGKELEIAFLHKIRSEQKFADLTALQKQIKQDIDTTIEFFNKKLGKINDRA